MLLHIILSFSCSTAEPDQTPRPQSPAETFCGNLGDAVARCGGSACDQAIAADCSSIAGLVNEPLLIDGATCLADGGGPADCLLGALESAVPSDAHRAFAESFCANCALGVPGCTAAFFDGSSGDTGLAGKIVLPFGDALVAALTEKCTDGFTCAATFQTCAQQVLIEQGLPQESAQCFLTTLISGASEPSCIPDVPDDRPDAGEPDAMIVDSGIEADAGVVDTGTRDAGSAPDTGAIECEDPREPNDGISAASYLGEVADDTSYPAGEAEAWLSDGDYDWYTFDVRDAILGGTNPRVEIDAFGAPGSVGLSACLFYRCDDGQPAEVECRSGALAVHDGLEGCCASGSEAAAVELGLDCPGVLGGEGGRAFVRVESIGDPTCDAYSLSWGDQQ